jgi:hypothetical protein
LRLKNWSPALAIRAPAAFFVQATHIPVDGRSIRHSAEATSGWLLFPPEGTMQKSIASFLIATFAVTLLFVAGCGDSNPETYEVKGTLKINGMDKIPAGTKVQFYPDEGDHTPVGSVNEDGSFTLSSYDDGDGAPAGTYKVAILYDATSLAAPGSMKVPTPGSDPSLPPAPPETSTLRTLPIDEKYKSKQTTDLKAEVKADGANEITLTVDALSGT